jgi:hypothetical protein
MRAVSTIKNPWIAEKLNMGDPDGVSRYVSELRQGKRPSSAAFALKITDIRVCPLLACILNGSTRGFWSVGLGLLVPPRATPLRPSLSQTR